MFVDNNISSDRRCFQTATLQITNDWGLAAVDKTKLLLLLARAQFGQAVDRYANPLEATFAELNADDFDSVELVIAIEDAFAVSISDADMVAIGPDTKLRDIMVLIEFAQAKKAMASAKLRRKA